MEEHLTRLQTPGGVGGLFVSALGRKTCHPKWIYWWARNDSFIIKQLLSSSTSSSSDWAFRNHLAQEFERTILTRLHWCWSKEHIASHSHIICHTSNIYLLHGSGAWLLWTK